MPETSCLAQVKGSYVEDRSGPTGWEAEGLDYSLFPSLCPLPQQR